MPEDSPTNEIANRIRKTCMLRILDYADILVDSGGVHFIGKLDTIQKWSIKIMDGKLHPGASVDELYQVYNDSTFIQVNGSHSPFFD